MLSNDEKGSYRLVTWEKGLIKKKTILRSIKFQEKNDGLNAKK